MIPNGTRDAHQWLGVESSNSGLTGLGQRSNRNIGITATGQPDSGVIHQPLGGTNLSPAHRYGKYLWLWALCRDLVLVVQHIPGVDNQIADSQSRELRDHLDCSWKLSPAAFQRINAIWVP